MRVQELTHPLLRWRIAARRQSEREGNVSRDSADSTQAEFNGAVRVPTRRSTVRQEGLERCRKEAVPRETPSSGFV